MSDHERLRVVMITPLDFDRAWNNREHNMARRFAAEGCEVAVLFRHMNRRGGLGRMLLDCVTVKVHSRTEAGTQVVRVDPLFNYYGGVKGSADAEQATERAGLSLRAWLVSMLSPLSCLRDLGYWPIMVIVALWKLRGRWDVAIGFGPWGALIAWTLQRVGKVRRWTYEDRDYEPGMLPHGLRRRYTAWLERAMMRRSDLIVTIGRRLERLRRVQARRHVHYIPTGVDWEKFAPARQAAHDGYTLVYTGNLVSWSGVELAIRAMPGVLRAHPSAQLLLIGSGLPAYEHRLKSLVSELTLDDAVEFAGSQPYARLPEWLARADVGLATSLPNAYRRYACPLKVIEYMASGLPVIATRRTEAETLVRACNSGVATAYDVGPLQRAIVSLLSDRTGRQRMGECGVAHSQNMDWSTLMRRDLSLIRSLADASV